MSKRKTIKEITDKQKITIGFIFNIIYTSHLSDEGIQYQHKSINELDNNEREKAKILFYGTADMVKNIIKVFGIDLTINDIIEIANINLYDKTDFIFK